MTEDSSRAFGPLHPVTRLGRVLQQLGSFSAMQAGELDDLASTLEQQGSSEAASKLRALVAIHTQEQQLIADEVTDLQAELRQEAMADALDATDQSQETSDDPARDSPKRARWLAEQAAQQTRPLNRRQFFRTSE